LSVINDQGAITHMPFLTEYLIPRLQQYAGERLFFGVDPLQSFISVDRNKPIPAGLIGRRWAEDLCRLNGRTVTVQITDHPSNAAVESGRHVAGDVQLRAGFPAYCTLKLNEKERVEKDGAVLQTAHVFQPLRI